MDRILRLAITHIRKQVARMQLAILSLLESFSSLLTPDLPPPSSSQACLQSNQPLDQILTQLVEELSIASMQFREHAAREGDVDQHDHVEEYQELVFLQEPIEEDGENNSFNTKSHTTQSNHEKTQTQWI